MMICAGCRTSIPDHVKFCPKCGTKAEDVTAQAVHTKCCPKCGAENPLSAKFCKADGYPLQQDEQELPKAAQEPGDTLSCPTCGTSYLLTAEFCRIDGTPLKGAPAPLPEAEQPPMPEETGQSPDSEADQPASEEATRLSWLMWAPQPESRETDEKQETKVAAQPDVEVGAGAVGRPSRSWLWLAAAGVVLLLASGTGYLYFSGLLGKNPDKVQMKLNAELKAQGLNDIFVEIGKDWVATVSGFVDNEVDKGRALGIVKTDKDVKDIEDRITLVTAEGSPAKTATEHPTAHAPEERAATAANIPVSTPDPLQQRTPAPAEKLSAGYSAETVRQYIQLGKAFHNEGDYDRAIKMFERVRQIDPDNVEAWRGTKQAEEAKVTETRVLRK